MTILSLSINNIQKMFWQGGGKKRLRTQIESVLEVPRKVIEKGVVGHIDEELLMIYYYRDQENGNNSKV